MAFSKNLRVIALVAFLVATFLLISSHAASVAHNRGTATASDQLGRKVKAERQYGYGPPVGYGPPIGGYAPPVGYGPPIGGYAPPVGGYYPPPYGGRPPSGDGRYSTSPPYGGRPPSGDGRYSTYPPGRGK